MDPNTLGEKTQRKHCHSLSPVYRTAQPAIPLTSPANTNNAKGAVLATCRRDNIASDSQVRRGNEGNALEAMPIPWVLVWLQPKGTRKITC